DAEYRRFVGLREERRRSSVGQPVPGRARHDDPADDTDGEDGHGAGLVAVVSVLAPLLAGTAALIFLLVGYGLHLLAPEPGLAAPMRDAGWTFAVLAAASALLGMGGVLLTALRNGPSAVAAPVRVRRGRRATTAAGRSDGGGGAEDEVAAARADWQRALLERGILPFLREALADPAGAERSPESPARELPEQSRSPRLGYSHPGFSSPAENGREDQSSGSRPRFSSPEYGRPGYGHPDFESPGHGSPEARPE
ncbi:hypothetical protein N566_12685, partial [Streptomycetaceae bacterium MP113-05]